MQQQRQRPIESNYESEDQPITRTGDDVPTSNVTPREAKTMTAAPVIFWAIGLLIAIIVAVILFALK